MLRTFVLILLITICSCAGASQDTDYLSLEQLLNLEARTEHYDDEEQKIRFQAMREEAINSGLENGYLAELSVLEEQIIEMADLWDSLLPFNSVMALNADTNSAKATYLVPGIIDAAENVAIIDNDERSIRTERRNLQLRKQPRVTLSMLSWRDYLFVQEPYDILPPSEALLPQNKEEIALYQKWVKKGWVMGQEQARYEVKDRLIRAFVDLTGMVRYVNEYENGRLRRPELMVQNQAVINHGDELASDVTFLQIEGEATFVSDTAQWGAQLLDSRGSVRKELQSAINRGELTLQDIEDSINHIPERQK